MRLAEKMPAIALPRGIITGPKSVQDDTSFLDAYVGDVKEGLEQLIGLLNKKD